MVADAIILLAQPSVIEARPGDFIDITLRMGNQGDTPGNMWIQLVDNISGLPITTRFRFPLNPLQTRLGTIRNLVMPDESWNIVVIAGHEE